ncbi:MAG: ATP-binding cassette domain-containing protein [Alphaproteobacteria bacterium]
MLNVKGIDLFYGASQALRSIDVTAKKGSVTCVLGRNGVGKTSLLRSIVGQEKIRSGSIEWDGRELSRLASFDRASVGIAIVPQGREIFPLLTVEENLKTGFAAVPRKERFIPDEIFDLFPVLKDMLGRRGGDLSGGQQQQLAIGRALVTRPIDEVIRALGARGDMAILLVEQYFDFACDLMDEYIVLDRGEVVIAGAASDMVESDVRRYLTV